MYKLEINPFLSLKILYAESYKRNSFLINGIVPLEVFKLHCEHIMIILC